MSFGDRLDVFMEKALRLQLAYAPVLILLCVVLAVFDFALFGFAREVAPVEAGIFAYSAALFVVGAVSNALMLYTYDKDQKK